jgi:hypothetical protein
VSDPTGVWHCNDDTSGRDPDVTIARAPTGTYRIWVGKYGDGSGPNVTGKLFITENALPPAPPTAPAPLAINTGPLVVNGERVQATTRALAPGFEPDPVEVQVYAGGQIQLGSLSLGAPCSGWVSADPDVIVDLSGTIPYLRMFVTAPDTALAIRDPQGVWHCSTHVVGTNPEVALNGAAPGRYRIWIGKVSAAPVTEPTGYIVAKLIITERRR